MQLYSLDNVLPESVNDWETDFWLELSAYYRNQSSQYCTEEPRDANIALLPKDNFDSSLHGEPEDLLCAQHISQSATGNLGEAISQNVSVFFTL